MATKTNTTKATNTNTVPTVKGWGDVKRIHAERFVTEERANWFGSGAMGFFGTQLGSLMTGPEGIFFTYMNQYRFDNGTVDKFFKMAHFCPITGKIDTIDTKAEMKDFDMAGRVCEMYAAGILSWK
jgi:hypothetical protein